MTNTRPASLGFEKQMPNDAVTCRLGRQRNFGAKRLIVSAGTSWVKDADAASHRRE